MPKTSAERCSECGRIKPGSRRNLVLEKRVLALWTDGYSVRRIAAQLEMSKSSIGRILQVARA